MRKKKHEYWVTNIASKTDVMLADLRLTVRARESRNLLDSRHYSYTIEQLKESAENGSIKAKSKFIKVRDLPPRYAVPTGIFVSKHGRLVPQVRNKVEITDIKYEELDGMGDKQIEEKFAAEDADIINDDNAPALPVDKVYKNTNVDKNE